MAATKGNLDQVRAALQGITGVDCAPIPAKYWFMWIVRSNHEMDAVDSFRRHGVAAYWPSYEKLIASRRSFEGRPIRRLVRSGIVPYVFTPASEGLIEMREEIVAVFDVARSVSFKPLGLCDADMRIIRKIDAGKNTPAPKAAAHDFKVGEKVRFADDEQALWSPGKITKLARDGRIIVDVEMMGRKVPFTVFPFQIERT